MSARAPSEPPEGTNPTDTLILDFRLPEAREDKFTVLDAGKSAVICYGSPERQRHLLSPSLPPCAHPAAGVPEDQGQLRDLTNGRHIYLV